MAICSCLAKFLAGRKKKSKNSPEVMDDGNRSINDGKLEFKSSNMASSSTQNGLPESHITISDSSPMQVKRSSCISEAPINDNSLVPGDFIQEIAYEGGDEHDESRSMKRDYSDFDLQAKGELASHGSNTELNNFGFEIKVETDGGLSPDTMLASGHVSDPGLARKVFEGSPVLKRSCSNIETKRATESINSVNRLSSYSNLQNLLGLGGEEVSYEDYSSPISVKTSRSADRVMLRRRSSCQVLPSRSRKIWWKLFLWSHRNLHKFSVPQKLVSVLSTANPKVGYSSDTHEPSQKLDKMKKAVESQWVAFSSESSPRDRVNAWINSLVDDGFGCEENHHETLDEGTVIRSHFEIGESSGKSHSHTSRHAIEEVIRANNIIRSLNSFSSVAHISNMGLKVIPTISAFGGLRSVNLSGNFIVHISPGSLPKGLHTLDLSRNKIATIEGLKDLTKLRVLNLSYNRIARIGRGLSNCTIIKELYLAGNKIGEVEGLHRLLKLTVVDLSFNKISTAKALGQLVANYNSLMALNLIGNPIQSCVGDEQVKKTVLSLLPHLTYLNKQQIKQHRAREVPASRAAIVDTGRSSQRRPVRLLSQVSSPNSSTKKKTRPKGKYQQSSLRR
ncbi:uncharacterized protein LOC110030164 [Phalaenopsis equestris]|uniref:uncharacterized protein LOC110030164 n=1 Tax=Phalaenopsis equestris TaxID=78828 RepID=UPI0009E550D9|nr:uncharacterized protein LOC110030164 [Phalaenopsis equestris]